MNLANQILKNMNETRGAIKLNTAEAIILMDKHKNTNCRRCWGKGYETVNSHNVLCRGRNCVADGIHKEKSDAAAKTKALSV